MGERLGPSFTLDHAVELATEVHAYQFDKSGNPYIEHPLAVMSMLRGDAARMAGVLHDVIEDTHETIEDLKHLGVPQPVLDALEFVTHSPDYQGTDEEYFQKIQSIAASENQIAIDVKWADLTHNSDITRIDTPNENDYLRVEKYLRAKEILKPLVSPYLVEEK